ncbi:MAG: peptidoglycan-binding domain-containing protein [Actinomycetes bacterium]
MRSLFARRILGVTLLSLAVVAGAAACSSDKKSSTTSTTSTTAASAPTTSGAKPVSTLTKADIVQMQEWLDAVGCDVGNNDGVIGPLTIASLKSFQKGAGLTIDGAYGPKTKAALSTDAQAKKQVCVKPTPTPPPVGPTGAVAPCTSAAITAGLDSAMTAGDKVTVNGFGCDSGWAYAWATLTPPVSSGAPEISVTDVLASRDGKWVSQDRGVVCQQGKLPSVIYTNGCMSN